MKKFLLIDDHIVVRSGIKALLLDLYEGCEVYEADDDISATEQLKVHIYDLVMMDVQIPNADMIGQMEYIHIKYPGTKVLIFSMSAEKIFAKRFLQAGAKGFLSKHASLDEMTKAIKMVLNNRIYISELLTESLAEDSSTSIFDKLSIREFEIISLLLSGHTITDISRSLYLEATTIGTHKARAFKKLGIKGLLQLKELAAKYDL